MVKLPIQTLPGISLVFVTLDGVAVDIPALIGLVVFDAESLMVDTATNRIWKRVVTSRGDESLRYVDIRHVPSSVMTTTYMFKWLSPSIYSTVVIAIEAT